MNTLAYEVERFGDEDVMVSPASRQSLGEVDSVVFDCDGVLKDVRESYDSAIARTAATMVKGFTGARLPIEKVGGNLILRIRRTGGFNNDWETTYAMTVFSVLALGRSRGGGSSDGGAKGALQKLGDLVRDFSSQDRLKGRASVDEYLERKDLESDLTADLREYIDYPVDHMHNRMTRTFDEMYYGGELFQRVYGIRPLAWHEEGLIERERVLITRDSMDRLKKVLGGARIAIATGSPFVAVQHTLGRLLNYFDKEASVYIGDGDVDAELAPRLRKFKKPSGASLVRAYEKLSSHTLLYVGDSAEDRLMVQDARRTHNDFLFAGVYGTSFSEDDQIAYFTRSGSDLITRTVKSVPTILERMRA